MIDSELLDRLRAADEDTVAVTLAGAIAATPLSDPVELLEFFNCMLDVLTNQCLEVQADDLRRLAEAAGTTTLQ